MNSVGMNLCLYKYENVCLFLGLHVQLFLSQFESDWYTIWHKITFWFRECSNTKNETAFS